MAWRSRPRGKSPSRSAVLTLSVCQDRLQGVFKPQSVSGTGSPLTRMLPARGAQFQTTAPDTDIPNFPLCLAQKRGLGKAPGFLFSSLAPKDQRTSIVLHLYANLGTPQNYHLPRDRAERRGEDAPLSEPTKEKWTAKLTSRGRS